MIEDRMIGTQHHDLDVAEGHASFQDRGGDQRIDLFSLERLDLTIQIRALRMHKRDPDKTADLFSDPDTGHKDQPLFFRSSDPISRQDHLNPIRRENEFRDR